MKTFKEQLDEIRELAMAAGDGIVTCIGGDFGKTHEHASAVQEFHYVANPQTILELIKRFRIAEEALDLYADHHNYKYGVFTYPDSLKEDNNGDIARGALAEIDKPWGDE